MKKKILVLLMLIISLITNVIGQKILTLKECYDMAYAAAPLAGEKDTYKDIWQLRDKNLSRSWLPTLDANGSIIYNS